MLRTQHCAPSATFSGLNSTLFILLMLIQAGRPQAPSSPQKNLEGITMPPELNSRPRLAPGCRLGENNQQRVLLMPERALRLNGPSLEILERCDGKRSVRQITVQLQQIYSKAEPKKVETDILDYLARLNDQRALDFEL